MRYTIKKISNSLKVSAVLKIPFIIYGMLSDNIELTFYFIGAISEILFIGMYYFDWFIPNNKEE